MSLASELEGTIADRFALLDMRRRSKLDRARECAMLTIPSLLPPEDWSEEYELPQPFSSVGSRGVTALASRMLSALIPLNDLPFFSFAVKNGVEPPVDMTNLLDALSMQVYEKMKAKNIRDSFFTALQSLIVVGDVAVKLEEDFTFRCIRFDQYVAIRDVVGDLVEFIHLEFIPNEGVLPADSQSVYGAGMFQRTGFKTLFCRYVQNDEGNWVGRKEDADGNLVDEGVYEVFPYAVLRWNSIISENYGRAKCEEIYGDLKTLESYTESLIHSMAAASTFFMGVTPTGVTELTDLATAQNGEWVAARQEDVYVISPAQTMNPQIQQTQNSVEMMRREIGEAFLMNRGSIRNAERVTATEVRMIGQELEQVLGGAFSSIARDLLVPMIERTVFLMIQEGDIDERLGGEFFDESGRLSLDIITGLQALSRDTELQKLMQMGEMIRNLPGPAVEHFNFEAYGKALIAALGFDPNNWIKTEQELEEKKQEMMAKAQEMRIAEAAGTSVAQGVGQGVGAATQQMAPQVVEQIMTGGGSPVQGGPPIG